MKMEVVPTYLSSFASYELNIKLPSFKDLSTFNV